MTINMLDLFCKSCIDDGFVDYIKKDSGILCKYGDILRLCNHTMAFLTDIVFIT